MNVARPQRGSPAERGPILRTHEGPLTTPDGRYIVVEGKLWRRSNPSLTPEVRASLVAALMRARRDVRAGLRNGDAAALADARARVHEAKVGLGERGPVWWTDGARDETRRLVANTPYADWYAALIE